MKTVELENRREKLKKLLDAENQQYEKEIEGATEMQFKWILAIVFCLKLRKYSLFFFRIIKAKGASGAHRNIERNPRSL